MINHGRAEAGPYNHVYNLWGRHLPQIIFVYILVGTSFSASVIDRMLTIAA